MALRLHERAHHAVAVQQLAVLRRQAGDDGVVGPLARREGVGVGGVQREQPGPVVQHDAGAGGHHAGAEVGEDAVDERAGVALPVHGADVHRVAAGDGLPVGRGHHRLARVYQLPPLGRVFFGYKLRRRHVHHAGVGDVAIGVGEGQPHGLDQVVIGVRRLRAHRADVEALGDVQSLQRRDALAVGRAFPAGDAPGSRR